MDGANVPQAQTGVYSRAIDADRVSRSRPVVRSDFLMERIVNLCIWRASWPSIPQLVFHGTTVGLQTAFPDPIPDYRLGYPEPNCYLRNRISLCDQL